MRRWLARILGVVFTASAIGYFVLFAVHNAQSLPPLHWTWYSYIGIGVGILLWLCLLAINSYAWTLLLWAVGESLPFKSAIVLYLLANCAKYIPGNVGHLVGRVALAHRIGLRAVAVTLTLFLEVGWYILSGFTLAFVLLMVNGEQFDQAGLPTIWQVLLAVVCVAGAPLAGAWILNYWRPRLISRLVGVEKFKVPDKRTLCACFCFYASTFLFMGAIVAILARTLFDASDVHFWLVTGFVAAAWVGGFITPGSPGGLGVREAILVAGLGPFLGSGLAVGLSVAWRVVSLLGDALAFLIALFFRRLVSTSDRPL